MFWDTGKGGGNLPPHFAVVIFGIVDGLTVAILYKDEKAIIRLEFIEKSKSNKANRIGSRLMYGYPVFLHEEKFTHLTCIGWIDCSKTDLAFECLILNRQQDPVVCEQCHVVITHSGFIFSSREFSYKVDILNNEALILLLAPIESFFYRFAENIGVLPSGVIQQIEMNKYTRRKQTNPPQTKC